MTCVLPASVHHVGASLDWTSMSAYPTGHMAVGAADQTQAEYASSVESEPRKGSASGGKKRPSRAGTRSVSTLSAAQLERKRANDREAQRAIRQRTKDHISGLERSIGDLQMAQEASEHMLAVTRQRNRELEEENAYLRDRLTQLGYQPPSVPGPRPSAGARAPEQVVVPMSNSPSAHATAGNIPRSDSTGISVAASRSSNSRHGSWPHGQPNFGPTSAAAGAPLSANLTTWRSHDGAHGMQTSPPTMQDAASVAQAQAQAQASFAAVTTPTDRVAPWSTGPQAFAYADQSTPRQQYQHPPQAEFQAMNVSSPTGYTIPTAQYTMGMPDSAAEYSVAAAAAATQQGHPQMQAAHLQAGMPQFQPTTQSQQQQQQPSTPQQQQQQRQQQQQQQRLSFRDDATAAAMGYAISHYSSG